MNDPAVRIGHMAVQRPGFAIRDLSLSLHAGSVLGLVGPNGAGKTTTIRALLGLLAPDAGTVRVLGQAPGARSALARTGVVLDEPTAAAEWSVASLGRRLGPFYPGWDQERFTGLLEELSVPSDRPVGDLSRGQGVKLSVATALAQGPDLLILDEPSSGLDPSSRRRIGDLIREFMVDPAHTVLFSTHITTDLVDLADELVVLVDGAIAHQGTLDSVAEEFAMARGSGPPSSGPVLGLQQSGAQWSALIRMRDSAAFGPEVVIDDASIDDVIIHLAADSQEVAA
ncbi:ABC transporter ATP-binding protein [Brachybacterium sacelli]|uniref:ABC-2 type transport system ATP-binding protein n=1 Tax=Brachybacterium sacelli TaxID=173364 RepID=A0ABS4X6X4_9MICO|nr:ABC transporter ATP-binding protein [Brachybacterium sacelli]MBP2384225.1 ABC-2 type transport system ATP-binding protein [Brachybacterium sacelli]